MKKIFTLLLALVATTALWAYDFKSGSLYYNITSSSAPYTVEVTYQAEYSTTNYSGLTTATIPKTVTYSGKTYSVTSIGASAFFYCSGLTSITIPNSVTSIETGAFTFCSGLTSVTIGNSVTSIGSQAFYNCSSLTSITIPNSVTSIGEEAFVNCSGLTSVTIGNSVTKIGYNVFVGCSSLTSITIPNSVTGIGHNAFKGCTGLTSVVWNAKNYADYAYSSSAPFYDIRSQITSFTFGDSVQHIPAYLCYEMSRLTSITIPNSVTSIGEEAFVSCYGLTSVTIPNSVTSIGLDAFSHCSGLTSVVWNAKNCFNFSSSSYAPFSNISSQITSFTFGDSVENIPAYLCCEMSNLTSITIPNSVTRIEWYAFWNCSGLTSITIPNSVTSIGLDAFYGCTGLTSVVWNAKNCVNFSSVSTAPFSNISSQITSFTFGDSVENIPAHLCCEMSNLTSITIPNSVTEIEWYAFYECSGLTSVTIGNSVTSIGSYAFGSCSGLTSITIPNSVTSIGGRAFGSCSGLTSIESLAETPPTLGSTAFYNVSTQIPVYVPCGSVSAYQSAEGWKAFWHIQCESNEPSTDLENTHSPSPMANCQKVIRDGQLIILRDGKTYNAMGQEL